MASYPEREPFFANRFIRLLVKSCVANEIGTDAFALLTTVAMTEDASHYKRGVFFYDVQLMPILGISSASKMVRVRRKAVESGWLHYEPGHKGKCSTYWVTIPKHAEGLDDAPTDEGHVTYADSETQVKRIESASETNRERKRNESGVILPIPNPNPTPLGGGGFSEDTQAKAVELYAQYGKRRWGSLWKNDISCDQGQRDLREISSRIHAIPTAYEELKAYFANPPPGRPSSEKLWQIFKHLELEASSKPNEKPRPSQTYRDFTAERLAGQFSIIQDSKVHP